MKKASVGSKDKAANKSSRVLRSHTTNKVRKSFSLIYFSFFYLFSLQPSLAENSDLDTARYLPLYSTRASIGRFSYNLSDLTHISPTFGEIRLVEDDDDEIIGLTPQSVVQLRRRSTMTLLERFKEARRRGQEL